MTNYANEPADSKPVFQLTDVSRIFGTVSVLENLSLTVAMGEFVALVGPSGSGKTTLLNLMSGFDQPTSGTITRPPRIRSVYQQSGLLPWKTVRENILLGLRDTPMDDPARMQEANGLLSLIGLADFADFYPHKLSGGMRQRVELARALAGDGDALLMDEPFSALDYLTRLKMRAELSRLLATPQYARRAVVLVTHDIEEATQLADRVLVLTERPARIARTVDLRHLPPRPRPVAHPLVVAAMQEILHTLGVEAG